MTFTPTTTAPRPHCEVADIFRQYGQAYRQAHPLPWQQEKVMEAIVACRTAALGGHLEQCERCGHQRPVYNSCRNRNCPKCQALTKAQWLHDRQSELLPVGYFHSVFTLPHELNPLALANPVVVYNILFHSVAQTLQQFAADPQYGLGGQLGFTAVLHTWDQKLQPHIHLHCVIAGGALSFDRQRWIAAKPNYLFDVRELSRIFRDHFLEALCQAHGQGELRLPASLQTAEQFADLQSQLRAKDWVVFSKKSFAEPQHVLDYLGRYTHRIAISNHRLRAVADGQVTFDYRDRKHGNQVKQLTVPVFEFIRRFLLHVVPLAFCRIRHFGFLANRVKQESLARCRELLGVPNQPRPTWPGTVRERLLLLTGTDPTVCPHCQGRMVVVQRFPVLPVVGSPEVSAAGVDWDSS